MKEIRRNLMVTKVVLKNRGDASIENIIIFGKTDSNNVQKFLIKNGYNLIEWEVVDIEDESGLCTMSLQKFYENATILRGVNK